LKKWAKQPKGVHPDKYDTSHLAEARQQLSTYKEASDEGDLIEVGNVVTNPGYRNELPKDYYDKPHTDRPAWMDNPDLIRAMGYYMSWIEAYGNNYFKASKGDQEIMNDARQHVDNTIKDILNGDYGSAYNNSQQADWAQNSFNGHDNGNIHAMWRMLANAAGGSMYKFEEGRDDKFHDWHTKEGGKDGKGTKYSASCGICTGKKQ
jgi:hypothetical protein